MPAHRFAPKVGIFLLLLLGCGRAKTFNDSRATWTQERPKLGLISAKAQVRTARNMDTINAGSAADLALGQYRIFLAATVPAVGAAVHEQTGSPPISQAAAPTLSTDCGGDLPPCYVMMRESGGSYGAFNPSGCGGNACYGKWQFSGAWAGELGLPDDLSQATPAQQDAAARQLWANGAGCRNWDACA